MNGTQFKVGRNSNATEVKLIIRVSNKNFNAVPIIPRERGFISVFIKLYSLISAFGLAGNSVLVLQDFNMDPYAIDVYRMTRLGMTSVITTCGYFVTFCNKCRWKITCFEHEIVQPCDAGNCIRGAKKFCL